MTARLLLCVLCASAVNLSSAAEPDWDTFADTWVATDALGRSLPTRTVAGEPKANRAVGVFYFLWLGQHDTKVHDLSKILAANPADPKYGPAGAFHFWGEPLFGYYRSDDRFVLRKHAQMLADAGVDVMILDVTNALTYRGVYTALCEELTAMRALGQRTPQVAFIANSKSAATTKKLYDEFYAKNLFPDLWFQWKGKPLLLTPPDGLDPAVTSFFTIRHSWAWSDRKGWFKDGRDKWTWIDHYPQKPGWHDAPDRPEELSVCVAQHPVGNIGRSFHAGKQPPADEVQTDVGLCFAEQWQRALDVGPEFVLVTGWNEWVAQRFVSKDGRQPMLGKPVGRGGTFFVDQYSEEFSRDIEPMTGGHGDNYYYQMIDGIRRYKGVRPIPPVKPRPIVVDGQFDDWKGVTPEFRDTIGDEARRDHAGWDDQPRFVNQTGRNDLVAAKVSWDEQHVYFYVRTKDPITPPPADAGERAKWMTLLIDADQSTKTGWAGYDFAVNRVDVRPGVTAVERHVAGKGYAWDGPSDVSYRVAGNEMELAIPRAALGFKDGAPSFDFKWADNAVQTGDPTDFTRFGDAAPNDRYNYRMVP